MGREVVGEQRPDRVVVPRLVRCLEPAEHVNVAFDIGHLAWMMLVGVVERDPLLDEPEDVAPVPTPSSSPRSWSRLTSVTLSGSRISIASGAVFAGPTGRARRERLPGTSAYGGATPAGPSRHRGRAGPSPSSEQLSGSSGSGAANPDTMTFVPHPPELCRSLTSKSSG